MPSQSREIITAASGTLGTEMKDVLERLGDAAGDEEAGRAGWRIVGQRR